MKKILVTCILIITTIVCIGLGLKTRQEAKMKITQLSGEGNGYIIETSENHLVIIDGGTKNDAENLKRVLNEKGNPQIVGWYLTSVLPENSGALCEIINSNTELKISNIFLSFVTDEEWYKNTNLSEGEKTEINAIINTIMNGKYSQIVTEMNRRAEYQMDNLFITPLEVKEETTYQNIKDQNIALKVTNGFDSIIFLGDITENRAKNFITSNEDQFKNIKGLQLSGNTTSEEIQEIVKRINPEQVLISNKEKPEFIDSEIVYLKDGKEHTIEI